MVRDVPFRAANARRANSNLAHCTERNLVPPALSFSRPRLFKALTSNYGFSETRGTLVMTKVLIAVILAAWSVTAFAQAPSEQENAEDHARCQSFGYQYGTPQYGSCRMEFYKMREQSRASQQQLRQQNSQQLLQYGQQLLRQAHPGYYQPGINCYSNGPYTNCR